MSGQAEANKQAMEEYRKQLEQLGASFDVSARRVVSQWAEMGLREVKRLTPVGDHPNPVEFIIKHGKRAGEKVSFYTRLKIVGGTMKKRWTKTPTHKTGRKWRSGYDSGGLDYAIYVNNGHAIKNTKNGPIKGYYPGQHMLEKSITYARKALPALLNAESAKFKRKTGF